ncbi:hypothetical protein [Streptomyces sp. NPDC002537]
MADRKRDPFGEDRHYLDDMTEETLGAKEQERQRRQHEEQEQRGRGTGDDARTVNDEYDDFQ